MERHTPPSHPTSGGSDQQSTNGGADSPRSLSRRRVLAAAGGLVSTGVAGCLGLRGRFSEATQSVALDSLWASSRTTEYGGNHHQFAAIESLDDPVVVAPHSSLTGSDDCGIVALDSLGESAWRSQIDPEHCTPHAVGDIAVGTRNGQPEVFAGTEAGAVVGFGAKTGTETLRADALESIGFSAPVVGDFRRPGQVVVADFEGLILAIDPDETVDWRQDIETRISVDPILADLTGDGQQSLAVAHGRRDESGVTVFGADGQQRWTQPVDATPRSFTDLVDGSERLLVVGTREAAVCLQGGSGEPRWSLSVGEVVSVGDSYDNQLLVSADDGLVRSLSIDDGSLSWEQPLAEGDETRMNEAVVGDAFGDGTTTIAVTTYTGSVVVLDDSGTVLARHDHDESIYVAPQFADLTGDGSDDLLIMDGHGRLTAFEVAEA